jgi:hypothetical protein
MPRQLPVCQGLLMIEDSRSNSDTRYPLGLLWTSDRLSQRPLPENTQHSRQKDIHVPDGSRNRNPSNRAAADPRLRPRGHWDRSHSKGNLLKKQAYRRQ